MKNIHQQVETPYRRAKQEWDLRMGDSLMRAKMWRTVCMILLGICTILVIGNLYYASLPRRIPYVIEVAQNGEALYKGNIGETTYTMEEIHVRFYLKKFIEYTRTLSSDVVVVKKNWTNAYYFLTPTGANILNTYAQEIRPLTRYKDFRVDIKFSAILEHSRVTRQVDWYESVWNAKGELIAHEYWKGIFKFEHKIPSTQQHVEKNPLGFFIDTFNWTRVQE